MQSNGLNLDLLRGNRQATGRTDNGPPQGAAVESGPLQVTRRNLLTGMTVAAVARRPVLQAFGDALAGGWELVGDQRRAAFATDGAERWVIDPQRFDGRPRLHMERAEDKLMLALTGALYPGTDLPADFTCLIQRSGVAWQMRLQLAAGRTEAEVPFGAWLNGLMPAELVLRQSTLVTLAPDAAVAVTRNAAAEFSPDWTLRLTGSAVVALHLQGERRAADAAVITLAGPDQPSLLLAPPERRTVLTLERGTQTWRLWPSPEAAPYGRLLAPQSPFDRITVETGVDERALVAEAAGTQARVAFRPKGIWKAEGGGPLSLPLVSPRYGVRFTPDGTESALVAQFAPSPVWAGDGHRSLKLGGTPTTPPFELIAIAGRPVRCECGPTLLAMNAPMADAVVEEIRYPEETRVSFAHADGTIPPPAPAAISSVTVIRPEDLLVLTFHFEGLTIENGKLTKPSGATATITVEFPPQHIAEEAFAESAYMGLFGNAMPPIRNRLAGPSRLSFVVPAAVTEIPYSLQGLLEWTRLADDGNPKLLPNLPAGTGDPWASTVHSTGIEAPYRMLLAPLAAHYWQHSPTPVSHGGAWTELWHSQMVKTETDKAGLVVPVSGQPGLVRAVHGKPGRDPFNLSLPASIRPMVVEATNYTGLTEAERAIKASRLALSSLGAWADIRGDWPEPLTLESYIHRMMMGRDQYVKTVLRGYLLPFGHKASLITVTERQFNGGFAYLRKKSWIVVREQEKSYTANDMPFRTVNITDTETPLLKTPAGSAASDWVTVDDSAGHYPSFRFHLRGVDFMGETTAFTLPLYFITYDDAVNNFETHAQEYNTDSRNEVDLNGAVVTYTEIVPDTGDTEADESHPSFPTRRIRFQVTQPPAPGIRAMASPSSPVISPVVAEADVQIPALDGLMGGPQGYATVRYLDLYVCEGFGGHNEGQVYFEIMLKPGETPKALSVPSPIMATNMQMTGLSRLWGPIPGFPLLFALGKVVPSLYFQPDSSILGFMKLQTVLDLVLRLSAGLGAPMPAYSWGHFPHLFWTEVPEWNWPRLPHWPKWQETDPKNPTAGFTLKLPTLADLRALKPGFPFPPLPALPDMPAMSFDEIFSRNPPKGISAQSVLSGPIIPRIRYKSYGKKKLLPGTPASALPDKDEYSGKGVKLEWLFKLPSFPESHPIFVATDTGKEDTSTHLFVEAFYVRLSVNRPSKYPSSKGPKKSAFGVTIRVTNFKVALGPLEVPFNEVSVTKPWGLPVSVIIKFGTLGFLGDMRFLSDMAAWASRSSSTGNASFMPEQEEGWIEKFFPLPIPSFGIFQIYNVQLGLGALLDTSSTIPKPVKMMIALNQPADPFMVRVNWFCGGGFFQLRFVPWHVTAIAFGIELGAYWVIDAKVAKGALYLRATFAMFYDFDTKATTLVIGIRGGGQLLILGVLRVTAEIWIAAVYEVANERVTGIARLYFEVEFLFFSVSATVVIGVTLKQGKSASAGRHVAAEGGGRQLAAGGRRRMTAEQARRLAAAHCAAFHSTTTSGGTLA